MKKTLIALAVAASAAVSGSAMAWTQNGTGGSVDLGGTLTLTEKATPWEVKVGSAVTGLDALIQKGYKTVNIPVNDAIPVLGIRSIENFVGRSGVDPMIDFQGAINPSEFSNGNAPLTLVVTDNAGSKIGTLKTELYAGAEFTSDSKTTGKNVKAIVYANPSDAEHAFAGGLGLNKNGIDSRDAFIAVKEIDPEFIAKYNSNGATRISATHLTVKYDDAIYSVFYGSGIQKGKQIQITLDQAASGDAPIQWKASLPVTVSYQ
ncbi:TPA: hypothetical protein JWL09_005245 [Escherichia coli]|nr:hypothetical protein [Escherichia coli]